MRSASASGWALVPDALSAGRLGVSSGPVCHRFKGPHEKEGAPIHVCIGCEERKDARLTFATFSA